MIRLALLALSLLATLVAPAFAQSSPIPALPDSTRQTTYTITGSTCACAVGFQLYGDNNDVDSWVTVTVGGVARLSTDPTFGWTLTSPSGSLLLIARPITDAIITFNNPQTGTIQIIGAQRPRRLTEYAEGQGITAHSFNQIFNTLFAELREAWDARQGQLHVGTALSGSLSVPVRSSAGPTVTISNTTDYFLCIDTSGGGVTANLPPSPGTGLTYVVKDCTGHASINFITITPASGTIDGGSVFVVNTNYQSVSVTFTGAQWSAN